MLEAALERVVAFRPPSGFKDFARTILERADARRIETRVRQPFSVRLAARHCEPGIPPEFAFVREATRSLHVSDKPASGDDTDTGRGLQQRHFRELFGSCRHCRFRLSLRREHLIQDGERLGKHLFDALVSEFGEQSRLSFGREQPGILANDAERSQTRFDLRFQSCLVAAHLLVMSDQLFESSPPLIALAVDRMNAIEPQQFGEFARVNRIGFVSIFGNPRQIARMRAR